MYAVDPITDFMRRAPSTFRVEADSLRAENGRQDLRRDLFDLPCR